jgi:uncharacterized protein YbjT (DUF2867 family)
MQSPQSIILRAILRSYGLGMNRNQVLVLGGTGTTGRRISARLAARGIPHRSASRTSEPRFDWTDPATWDAVIEGARSVYLLPLDGEVLTRPFVKRAEELGVERVVLHSGRGVDVPGYMDPSAPAAQTHIDGEDAVRSSGLEWTILRPGWFAQNFSEGFFAEAVKAGEMRFPAGDGAATFVDVEDIADVAVAALTEDGHAGRTYELSGPRALSLNEVAQILGKARGKRVVYTAISVEAFVAESVAQGWAEEDARGFAEVFHPLRTGLDAHCSTGVEEALGRKPRTFEVFAQSAAKML